MAQYLILIYEDEARYATATPEVMAEVMQAHDDFAASVERRGGKLLGSEGAARSCDGRVRPDCCL